ncbi:MAG: aspartate/glutamate racemase family protein [Actinocatenispora sp.]
MSAPGPDVGVLLLDNQLPRPRGDVGNPATFAFPVQYAVIPGAATRLVVERCAGGLLDNARAAMRTLLRGGVRTVTTCCGFLAIFQRELAEEAPVPVATSSLMQIPLVLRTLRADQRVCVLTVNAATLTPAHFAAAGVTADELPRVVVAGLEDTEHFYPMIVEEIDVLDQDRAQREVVAAALDAVGHAPDIGAFVFECTNLPPYSDAVRQATSRPVWDATSLIGWLRSGVRSGHDAAPEVAV